MAKEIKVTSGVKGSARQVRNLSALLPLFGSLGQCDNVWVCGKSRREEREIWELKQLRKQERSLRVKKVRKRRSEEFKGRVKGERVLHAQRGRDGLKM